jgi:glutamate formiminotransferase / formiminotetrahydrofolate cyclodeaminase
MKAAEVPFETARWCAEVAELAAICAEKGNTNAASSDAGVAALLAEAACRGAAYNVRINVVAMPDRAVRRCGAWRRRPSGWWRRAPGSPGAPTTAVEAQRR